MESVVNHAKSHRVSVVLESRITLRTRDVLHYEVLIEVSKTDSFNNITFLQVPDVTFTIATLLMSEVSSLSIQTDDYSPSTTRA
jgi:hypothetical protein